MWICEKNVNKQASKVLIENNLSSILLFGLKSFDLGPSDELVTSQSLRQFYWYKAGIG